jgi:hypothetical protein
LALSCGYREEHHMKKFECYDYPEYKQRTKLFGNSAPPEDYFNDNLDLFYDEDDFYDYTNSLENDVDLEDKTFSHSHPHEH